MAGRPDGRSGGPRSVVIEADGGSRGNPGPAAYGAVLKDADTGAVIAEDGTTIGVATNNVAEYSGLIAGLELAVAYAPGAAIEVRMDSKLVVEQMSGRWKIKHPGMVPLAERANRLAPTGTTYTWVPREQNKHADRLANEALDGKRSGITVAAEASDEDESLIEEIESPSSAIGVDQAGEAPKPFGAPTTLILVRHGVTPHTSGKRFSGGLGGDNPGLSEEGREQVRAAAVWLSGLKDKIDAVVASPVRRTRESAEIIAAELGLPLEEEPGFAEMEFGAWDGLTFLEVAEQHKESFEAWLGSTDSAPPGGESFRAVEERVLAGLARVLEQHAGRTVVVTSHVTPIKTLVAHVLKAPLDAVFRMELSPASVSVVSFFPDKSAPDGSGYRAAMRLFNALPPGDRSLLDNGRW
ncbi:bifunctional RNase H/acid phosphatase [Nocardioides humilatus]|uniref:Bifunctional RNase H/acid phosphatase n=1 Tax=Nocardioides humilatus TaxID=2607660 RepID=A0A5B1L7X5_9ACTN|nr:bifunctional RNase H/acid phosphatase [Nocardioides humilatus]KAA1416793.1 bifunctional RNase H/acid phosphatase [Nocardioides humilatus]